MSNIITNRVASVKRIGDCFAPLNKTPESKHDEPCTESALCGLCPSSTEPEALMQTILEEAQKIVNGQRCKDHGDIRASFNRIAGMWSAYLDTSVSWLDVAHMMIMLKLSRNHENELAEKSKFNGEY